MENTNDIKDTIIQVEHNILNKKNKFDKKLNKKLAKAVNIILFHEKNTFENIFSECVSKNLWIYHFGNGDEDDQVSIRKYFNEKYGKCKIYIFPGISYGFIEFEDIHDADKVKIIENNKVNFEKIKANSHDIKFISGERTVFTFYTNISLIKVIQNNQSTFPIAKFDTNSIPGLYLIDDFITETEEKFLLEDIDKQKWEKLNNRRVQHYGFEFLYSVNAINKNSKIGEMPIFCNILMSKFENLLKSFKQTSLQHFVLDRENKIHSESFFDLFGNFDQLTINDYTPGDGIPPHVDSHSPFEDVFCSLSIESGAVMSFHSDSQTEHIYLRPRSLSIFSSEVRFKWEHSIPLRKMDRVEDNIYSRHRRISLTFRKIRKGECNCDYIQFCDSKEVNKIKKNPLIKIDTNEESLPTEIEKKHVYDVYDKIADHFSHTRYKPWPKVAEFMSKIDSGSLNADIGCGNGKYLNEGKNIFSVGTDRSVNLLSICRNKDNHNQVFAADSLKLPFRSNIFDSVISIAVIHHFSNNTLRKRALNELIRITELGGKILIYVWALEQENKKFEQQDNFVPWHLQSVYENDQKIESVGPQIIKEDKKNATVYHRYYHMFKKGELEELIKEFKEVEIVESYYDHANWCCILKKIN